MSPADIHRRFPKFDEWNRGSEQPTLKQLEKFANATHAPLGFLFLADPPVEVLPIPDYRTIGNLPVRRPSPDLLDTIYICQERQDWYRQFAINRGYEPLPFVGTVHVGDPVEVTADEIRRALGFTMPQRGGFQNGDDAFRRLIDIVEGVGILVMISGIVGGNTHRVLNRDEFRGFALADSVAPLIFVNGSDTKAAQMFTLVHELVHIWVGETALSDAAMALDSSNANEVWANQVAAEILVPIASIRTDFNGTVDAAELRRLANRYRVSTLVILKRLFDAGFLQWAAYQDLYADELDRLTAILARQRQGPGGGDFYNTQPLRVSQHFARAVIVDALEGGTLFRDAYGLVGAAKHETFIKLGEHLGVT
ncbi:ImmA/IrrE family metallo-endopeptidase [Agreia sp. PsM10]|uniref:ImmA/IrrE family metallo-endopeptidase n=1 Tax=Agreia sp. PsM10 TaxID=3030533 RepID=UPI00263AF266|nr:ImmA/IrrE family metallo-endopeptidase [Agreia sp. PsM10]MDN4642184.1 ImmA/IrrE family metallo-endopeptidase [Agreia sp. PsM10]